ncbi:MAG: 2-polyprenylphenol 6-hydroxylase [Deltaproteobacteria bacterium]|nr:2-polyprenylphenol 6-hydroxylase [Deltaproteobacteria bacterium]
MFFARTKAIKNIVRMRKIVNVLIKHGFGDFVEQLNIGKVFTLGRLFRREEPHSFSRAERARMAIEELGSTFIKFGQILSTRVDLLPSDWAVEFKKLQDEVPLFPYEEVVKVTESELKASIGELFESFEETPCASASIAQVHYARLKDGKEVAVKVQRPGIEKTISADLAILYTLAGLVEKYIPSMGRYEPLVVVNQFEQTITKELDFTTEGAHAGRILRMFKKDDRVIIPKVFWPQTGKRVLTMERVYGTVIDEVETLREKGIDFKKVAENSIKAFFVQVFDYGYFHADLHPGNLLVSDDGKIIYLDFGIMGRIDDDTRKYLAKMLFALIKRDFSQMAKVHLDMGLIPPETDLKAFEDELIEITEPIFGKQLNEINISELIMKLLSTAINFDMKLQPSLLLLQKSMIIMEGVGREFYPDLNIWKVAQPFMMGWMKKEISPQKKLEESKLAAKELIKTGMELPHQANRVLGQLNRGDLKIDFAHMNLEVLIEKIESHGNDLYYGIIVAALLLGSFYVIGSTRGPQIYDMSAVGLAGFAVALMMVATRIIKK